MARAPSGCDYRSSRTRPATRWAFVAATTELGAIVHTNGWPGYNGLNARYQRQRRVQATNTSGELLLPRAHRTISNLKNWLRGTHRSVGDQHLQTYLDEYPFRHTAGAPRWPRFKHSSA